MSKSDVVSVCSSEDREGKDVRAGEGNTKLKCIISQGIGNTKVYMNGIIDFTPGCGGPE